MIAMNTHFVWNDIKPGTGWFNEQEDDKEE